MYFLVFCRKYSTLNYLVRLSRYYIHNRAKLQPVTDRVITQLSNHLALFSVQVPMKMKLWKEMMRMMMTVTQNNGMSNLIWIHQNTLWIHPNTPLYRRITLPLKMLVVVLPIHLGQLQLPMIPMPPQV